MLNVLDASTLHIHYSQSTVCGLRAYIHTTNWSTNNSITVGFTNYKEIATVTECIKNVLHTYNISVVRVDTLMWSKLKLNSSYLTSLLELQAQFLRESRKVVHAFSNPLRLTRTGHQDWKSRAAPVNTRTCTLGERQ